MIAVLAWVLVALSAMSFKRMSLKRQSPVACRSTSAPQLSRQRPPLIMWSPLRSWRSDCIELTDLPIQSGFGTDGFAFV
jgi:hypothetical protein